MLRRDGDESVLPVEAIIPWKAVFFDFDGVIVDSMGIKTEAFARLFRPFGEEIERQVLAYHIENGGYCRFVKFRYALEDLMGLPPDEEALQKLGRRFSRMVVEQVVQAPVIAGAMETLKELKSQNVPTFVISGTPQKELEAIVDARKLSPFFDEVFGSPREKEGVIRELVGRLRLSPSDCLMVGDAMSDYRAAHATGVGFLGIVPEGEPSPFPEGVVVSASVRL